MQDQLRKGADQIMSAKVPFHGLGPDYFDAFRRGRKIRSYLKRLQALGWDPDASPAAA